jgi:hypothetical protein
LIWLAAIFSTHKLEKKTAPPPSTSQTTPKRCFSTTLFRFFSYLLALKNKNQTQLLHHFQKQ